MSMDGYPMPVADLLVDAAVADIELLASWMAMQGIIKYSWLKKIFPRLHLGVLAMLGYLNR